MRFPIGLFAKRQKEIRETVARAPAVKEVENTLQLLQDQLSEKSRVLSKLNADVRIHMISLCSCKLTTVKLTYNSLEYN